MLAIKHLEYTLCNHPFEMVFFLKNEVSIQQTLENVEILVQGNNIYFI